MQADFGKDSVFFGRGEILALFEKRLEAFLNGYRQNIGLLGVPLVGKSFLLRTFLSKINSDQILPIFFSCRPFESFEWFAERWLGELLLSVHRALGAAPPGHLQELIRSLRKAAPKTLKHVKLVKKMLMSHRYDQAYRELLGLTGTLQQETGKKIILILDDFDRLEDLELADPFADLGREIMIQKETMYLVSTSRLKQGRFIFREKLSLLFGNFEAIELNPFDFGEAHEWIEQKTADSNLDDGLKRFLIRLTNGHPYYLNRLLARIRFTMAGGSGDGRALLVQALAGELYERSGILNQCFERKIHSLSDRGYFWRYGDILLGIAKGHKKLSQMMRFLRLKGPEIKKVLEELLRLEVVQKHGSLFIIPDPLFRFWLVSVYYLRRTSFSALPLASPKHFQDQAGAAVEESVRADASELPKRIEELFRKFRGDVVELNQKRFHCPHFTEILSRPNNGRVFPVTAKNGKSRWLCQVLAGKVTEDDIRVFLEDVKRLRAPLEKKLMMGLCGIDINAKLLAQEAKIQYLDLKNLNFLLDVHDKPKVVV